MSDVYFIVIPVVVVVVILKLCLIFWRIWAYQQRRERNRVCVQQQGRAAPARSSNQPTARVVRVERCVGPDGYAQRTSYAIEQPRQPTRVVTRTIVVRPNSGRPADPNMPPTYDQAVTGKDKSVKVEDGANTRPEATPTAPPPSQPVMGMGAPDLPPPAYSQGPPAPPSAPVANDDSFEHDERSRLLC